MTPVREYYGTPQILARQTHFIFLSNKSRATGRTGLMAFSR
jgi:hypothetical protein